MNTLYVLYDPEYTSSGPIYGVFTDYEFAVEAKNDIITKWVDEILADDPAETGLKAIDREWLIEDCEKSIKIQMIPDIDKAFCS